LVWLREKGIFRLPGPNFKPKDPYYDEAKPKPSAPQPPSDVPSIPFQNMLPVNELLSLPFQSRTTEDPELAELVESIKTYGVIEPIVVRSKSGGAFEVVAGARRLRAAKEAGLTSIPVVIRALSDQEAYEIQLIENIQRKDLADIEKARMLDYMTKQYGYTQEQLAQKIGKSREWVANHLRMLQVSNIVSRETMEKMTEGQARAILSIPQEKQKEIAQQIEEEGRIPSMREISSTSEAEHRVARTAEVQLNPRWNEPSIPQPAVTTSIPSAPRAPEPPAPKPEGIDIAEITCPVCKTEFRLQHFALRDHRPLYYKE